MKPGLICNVLWSFFKQYVDQIEEAYKVDKNNKQNIVETTNCLKSSEETKKRIEILWGLNKDLLAGLFIYLDVADVYFNPRFNSKDLFFKKVCVYNKDLLEKIGKKTIEPAFPFNSIKNYKKKIVLLR